MKKKIFMIAAIIAAAAVAGTLCWFYMPGMHLLGPFGHIDLTKECYLFDSEGQESGTISVSIKGNVRREFPGFSQGAFAGVIAVAAEAGNEDEQKNYIHTFYRLDDGSYYLWYTQNQYAYDETEQRLYSSFDGDRYDVYLKSDDSFALVCSNAQGERQEYRFTAVCADSREEAADHYGQMEEAGLIKPPLRIQ